MFSQIFGVNFVPSTDWINATRSYRVATGLVTSVLLLAFSIKAIDTNKGELRKIAGMLFAPFFGYILGTAPIAIGAPMIVSMFAGHHIQIPYEVARADGYGVKGCRSPIELQGLPFLFDSLCGISDDLRHTVNPHMRIVVEGRGTSMGVYAKSFHPIKS
jgi:hypothetical protein